MITEQIKKITSELCQAMLRNVNENFDSVSFDVLPDNDIQVRVILKNGTEKEEELIDDLIAEFSALQESDIIRPAQICSLEEAPLPFLVYKHS
jgi:hypothetical protein